MRYSGFRHFKYQAWYLCPIKPVCVYITQHIHQVYGCKLQKQMIDVGEGNINIANENCRGSCSTRKQLTTEMCLVRNSRLSVTLTFQ